MRACRRCSKYFLRRSATWRKCESPADSTDDEAGAADAGAPAERDGGAQRRSVGRRRHGDRDAQRRQAAPAIKIDPEVVSKDEIEMLQDLIVAAVNDAHRKADEEMQKKMGGMLPPGMRF